MAATGVVASSPEIMPVKAVAKGMHGVGKTVVSGTQIEEFAVEILGIVSGQGPSASLILVRVSGPLIERTGGIAAGMSGSPVYVEGKLVGAVAYGFDLADHTLGLLTPAEDMELVLELASVPGAVADDDLPRAVALAENRRSAEQLQLEFPDNVAVAVPVATPLMVSGFGARAKALLEPALQRWNVMSVPTGRTSPEAATPPLEAGSAFGVQLIRGDVELTALGTVTYVDDRGFVGFGHPFLNRGNVDFFVTGAYIHEVVRGIQMPFKVGSPTSAIGLLSQDRGAGVAGKLGGEPEYIDVQVLVKDRSIGRSRQFQAQVIHDDNLTVPLAAIAMLEALDRAIDRIGPGTANVVVTLEGEELPASIVRDNIFYSSSDVSAAALSEVVLAIQKLLGNDLAALGLRKISFAVDVEDARRTARIESVSVHTPEVSPGGAVDLEVVMRPFRADPVKMSLRLAVPEDTPAGEIVANVRGGGYGMPRLLVSEVAAQLEGSSEEDDGEGAEEGVFSVASDLEKFLAELFDPDHNYDLVAEYYPAPDDWESEQPRPGVVNTPDADAKATKKGGEAKSAIDSLFAPDVEPVKAKVKTPYYVQGSVNVVFTVLPASGNESPEKVTNTPDE